MEGNYTIGNRSATIGWLEWAKPTLVGKSVLDLLPAITATSGLKSSYGPNLGGRGGWGGAGRGGGAANAGRGIPPGAMGGGFGYGPRGGGTWPNYYTATAEIALWDVMGKTAGRPVYKLLGGAKDRLPAYASSQHPANWEDFGPDVQKSKEEGYLGYKIHPGQVQPKDGKAISRYVGHMEGIKLCRKTAGDDFILAHDPVQAYNLFRGAQSWPAAG